MMARYYGYHGEDLEWKGKLHLTYPNTVNIDLNTGCDEYKQLMDYRSVSALDYERLSEGHYFLQGKRCLSDWCELR